MTTDVTAIPESEFWQRREWIAGVVERNLVLDLEPVKADLLEKLEEPSEDLVILERAERIARDAIDVIWGPSLLEQCSHGLDAAREEFLLIAGMCEAAAEDLAQNGLASWVAGAIRHRKAVEVCWDTLDERHGVEWDELDRGQGE